MDEATIHTVLLYGIFGVALITAVSLFYFNAPYGRHMRRGWGPTLPSTVGWIAMELPAVATIAICFALADRTAGVTGIVFLAMWELHYVYRTFLYPALRRGGGRPMPLAVVAMAIVFNVWNGYLNGSWLFFLGPERGSEWLTDPRFLIGASMFLTGLAINIHSDRVLIRLRAPGETGYEIPRGGLFRFVSAPNYLGELIEWTGWTIATWSIAGLSFAVFTAANLVPRAWANHRWYQGKFEDYPQQRRAVFPWLF